MTDPSANETAPYVAHPTKGNLCIEERRVSGGQKTYWFGTHRVVEPTKTISRMLSKMPDIGVTRIANVTGLDFVGIPVYVAVRPNSRNLSVHQGKGLTLEAAKASAMMEALEWFSGERPTIKTVWDTPRSLGDNAEIPSERLIATSGLTSDTELPWVVGTDLVSGSQIFVPKELVATDTTRPFKKGLGRFRTSGTGLAAGNTIEEARLHAICELVERDAFALWRLSSPEWQSRTSVDPATLGDCAANLLISRFEGAGLTTKVWDITSDIEVPSFFCVVDDRYARPPFLGRFGGIGCHPSLGVAMCRALTEAAQSRLTFIVGSRDDIPANSYSLVSWEPNIVSSLIAMDAPTPTGRTPVRAASCDTATIEGDLNRVINRLVRNGIDRLIEVDLTQESISVPCVRVLAPNLELASQSGYAPGERGRKAIRQ